jgi:hypothetical protein
MARLTDFHRQQGRTRVCGTQRTRQVYTGSGLRRVKPYVQLLV